MEREWRIYIVDSKENIEMKSLAFNENGIGIFVMSAIVTHLVCTYDECVRGRAAQQLANKKNLNVFY